MPYEPLDAIPLWALFPITAGLLWLLMEAGYRAGSWRHANDPNEQAQPVASIVAAILGLLALVLGFTFSLAASRFDDRRQAVLEEANAIGTTYLRTSFLPKPQSTLSADLLREYAEVRERSTQAEKMEQVMAQSESLHQKLWEQATIASEKSANPIMVGLYVQSLNEMIDLHAKRVLVGIRSRIPLVIWITLYGLSMLAMTAVGYYDGLSATSRSPLMIGLVVAFSIVLYLIADLDRSQEGLMRVSQQALTDVRKSMQLPSSPSPQPDAHP